MIKNNFKPLFQMILAIRFMLFFCIEPVYSQKKEHASLIQDTPFYSHSSVAEKIYLQFNSKVFTTDETIWFKSTVVNATDHTPTFFSGVLNVELIGPDKRIVERKLLKLRRGIGSGHFDLRENLPEGSYQIRAYTEWSKNFGEDFFFKEYIKIFASKKTENKTIRKIAITEQQEGSRRLTALFDPLLLDSLHKKKLRIKIEIDGRLDSLSIRKNDVGLYELDYKLPNNALLASLHMLTKNQKSSSRTICLDEDFLDLQFFPESGDFVHGISTKVGFKALDATGKGKILSGKIVDSNKRECGSFESNTLGMGSFVLSNPDSSLAYYAVLQSKNDEFLSLKFPLPKVKPSGMVMSVTRKDGRALAKIRSSTLSNDSLLLQVLCRGYVYQQLKGKLQNRKLNFSIAQESLPEGVVALYLKNMHGQPIAERLFFNEKNKKRLKLEVLMDKKSYSWREKSKLKINCLNQKGDSVNASMSLLVINKEQMGSWLYERPNMQSYILLYSDLRGKIERPNFYFENDSAKLDDLDALLLTQGWRKYKYTREPEKLDFMPETGLTISGIVKETLGHENRKKKVDVSLMTFGKINDFYFQKTDSLGKFRFRVNDEYGKSLKAVLQAKNVIGKNMNYLIKFDIKKAPNICFEQRENVHIPDYKTEELLKKNRERKQVKEDFPISSGDIMLKSVTVEDYQLTPQREQVMKKYGKPDVVLSGEKIRNNKKKWHFSFFNLLEYQKDIRIKKQRGYIYAQVVGSDITLILIDGIPVEPNQYELLPYVSGNSISSFEILKKPKGFNELYISLFNEIPELGVTGAIISIYTYGKKGLYGMYNHKGIAKIAIPVYSPVKEFYSPKYPQHQKISWEKPDLRALLHWEPELKKDNNGQYYSSFYNADNSGEMLIMLEAISDEGEIGYKVWGYDVFEQKSFL